jgi:hypothetical protein
MRAVHHPRQGSQQGTAQGPMLLGQIQKFYGWARMGPLASVSHDLVTSLFQIQKRADTQVRPYKRR